MVSHRTDATNANVISPLPSRKARAEDRGATRRRRAVAVAMAAQFAIPGGVLMRATTARAANSVTTDAPIPAPAAAETPAAKALRDLFDVPAGQSVHLPHLTVTTGPAAEGFATGLAHLRAGEYEEAVTSLRGVPVDGLGDVDQKVVTDALSKAREGASNQNLAQSDLIIGEQQMVDGTPAEAGRHLRACADSAYATADARQRATDGLARLTTPATLALPATPVLTTPALATPALATPAPAPAAGAKAPIRADMLQATQPTGGDGGITPAVPNTNTPPATGGTPPTPPTPPTPAPVEPAPMPVQPVQARPPVAAPPVANQPADDALAAVRTGKKIKLQQDQYQAQQLVVKARQELQNQQRTEALRDYTKAAELDPNNREATAGRDEVSTALNLGGPQAATGRSAGNIPVVIQEIYYHFNAAIDRANNNIASRKFDDAQRDIEEARVWRNHDTTLFTQPQLNDFDTTIQNTNIRLTTARQENDSRRREEESKQSGRLEENRRKQYDDERQRTIAGLIQTAQQYTDQGRYTEALNIVDNIQKLDPTNQYATGVRTLLQDKSLVQQQRGYKEQRSRETTRVLVSSDEELIPYSDIIHYPDNWPSLSEQRDNEVKIERGEEDEDSGLTALLDRRLPEVRFTSNTLNDVIEFLRDTMGANIYVDWKSLEAANILKDAPVSVRLHDIKFSKALEIIFKNVNGDDADHQLGYTVDEGVITISTKKVLNQNTVTRRYDINDLLFVPPDYNQAPQLDLQNATQGQQGGQGGGGGSNSQSLFQTGNQNQQNGQGQQTREERIDEIKKYISDNVDPTSWKDAGGEVGSISSSPLRAILLITQTPESQRKIVSVLDSLRASQALQVSIECRFLTVQRNYLEDIGVDADFQFNPLTQAGNPRSGYNSSRFSPIGISQNAVTNNTTFTDANGNVVNSAQGSRQLDWISNVGNAAVPGSIAANPADYPNPIVISGSYLDNFTVNFLIRAVQANQNTTNLTAPRLTLFSGQRAVLVVETQQAYVSDLNPVVGPGAALFDPQVSTTVGTGVVLSVLATVSPDRKYVFLDLQPQLARLRALVPFVVSAVVQPTVTTTGGGTTASQVIQGTLQLPTIDVTQVKTSVSVPDGATLLLGGQTLAAETVREQGVPVLSKIPFLKRLFTNRATSQDEQILLILVKPTILIQKEQEQKAFPSLSSRSGS